MKVATPEEVGSAVVRAREAFPAWSAVPVQDRVRILKRLNNLIYDDLESIATIITRECGKPKVEAVTSEIFPVMNMVAVLTANATKWLREEKPPFFWVTWLLGKSGQIVYHPYGVVGIISPWNYPFYYDMGPALLALLAGNTVVLKPSEYTPLVAEKTKELFAQLDLPEGTFQVVHGAGDVGEALVRSGANKIVFTGSPHTGRKVLAEAAESLTPVVMELGGKDAAIVLEDAPLEATAAGIAWGAFTGAGQVCASIERVYVSEKIADAFTQRLLKKVRELRQGRGLDTDVEIGPLTNERQLDIVKAHVQEAVEKGAKILTGGISKDGLFFTPTVLADVDGSLRIIQEETFGPVLPLIPVKDEDEAIRLANSSHYGLTASVWSLDKERAERVARRLEVGSVTINDHMVSAGLPNFPWGGVKESGFGRLFGRQGLLEFVYPTPLVGERFPRWKRLWWYPYNEKAYNFFRTFMILLTTKGIVTKIAALPKILKNLDLRRLF